MLTSLEVGHASCRTSNAGLQAFCMGVLYLVPAAQRQQCSPALDTGHAFCITITAGLLRMVPEWNLACVGLGSCCQKAMLMRGATNRKCRQLLVPTKLCPCILKTARQSPESKSSRHRRRGSPQVDCRHKSCPPLRCMQPLLPQMSPRKTHDPALPCECCLWTDTDPTSRSTVVVDSSPSSLPMSPFQDLHMQAQIGNTAAQARSVLFSLS